MTGIFKNADFDFFKSLLVEAGDAARGIQHGTIDVMRKNDLSIVTETDLMVQELLIRKISARYGDFQFYHEENFKGGAEDIDADTISVIIDPIDGTAMYSMYLPEWCVSVGIFRGYEPLYGFVYSPGFEMLFHNDNDSAYLNGSARRINRAIKLDTETNIFYASEVHRDFTIEFPGKIRNLGSTALHACLTVDNARNRTLAFIGRSRLWDWAGAIPIILKAGGYVRYLNGDEIKYQDVMRNDFRFPDFIVAYNVNDFEAIRNIFKKR
jgi:myo-inositol-1(or 4)-monophosphatase